MMTRLQVEMLKTSYRKGTRVKCLMMNDYRAVPSGTEGTVDFVDDIGTIHVTWDNGRTLGLIYGEDEFTKI